MASKSISRPSIGLPKQKPSFIRSASQALLSWRQRYYPSPVNLDGIKVVCIADTHNTKPDLPNGDILLHAGDLSQYGTFDEVQNQLTWLNSQPHKWKIVIAGNHDLLLDEQFVMAHPDRELQKPGKGREDLQWGDIVYLQDSSVELDIASRRIKVYGSPSTLRFGNFAFQHGSESNIWDHTLSNDIDILLAHGPPLGYLDDNGKGCALLLRELRRAKPRLVVFGHIHTGRGQCQLLFDNIGACYENIAQQKQPMVNLLKMMWEVVWLAITRAISLSHSPQIDGSQLVNAAVVGGQYGRDMRERIVTYI